MAPDDRSQKDSLNATASLEILTGPARGTASWLSEATLEISVDDEDMIQVSTAGTTPLENGLVARLHRSGDSYEIEALQDNPLWINGERVESKQLQQRDLIEFGDKGPLSRFRVHRQGDLLRRSLGDMLEDCIDYTRVSRRPRLARLQKATGDLLHDFALRTTLFFRISVILALIGLAYISYQQYRSDILLQQQATRSADQMQDFARRLTRTDREAIRPSDLNRLRQELRHSITDTAERIEQLEQRSEAASRIIASASRAIVFLQGAYGYREVESQRLLRYQIDEDGNPLFSLRGQPLLTLEGEGELALLEFTGTAFLVSDSGALLTNRHVALPWEEDASLEIMTEMGMEPVMVRLIGYAPGIETAFPLELLQTSEETDLALLKCSQPVSGLPYLGLSRRQPELGDEVIVMGYPTGLRSLVAQSGEGFLTELQSDEELDFWQIAERLSRAELIRPLASRGIVGQRSAATVVYDAETTSGGSGGPVLDIDGRVVAINSAVIPEYGGSNFGIPAEFARRLLQDAGVEID